HVLTPQRGLGRGFDVYDAAHDGRDARSTTQAALAKLEGLAAATPVFLWVHYIDPHVPYYPPPALATACDPGYTGRYAAHFGGAVRSVGERAYPEDLSKPDAVHRNRLPDAVNAHIRRLYAA